MTIDDQLAWMRAQIASHTYKPGWQLAIRPGSSNQPLLIARYVTDDARRPGHQVNLRAHRSLALASTPTELGATLLDALDDMEKHETREWLRYNGQLVADPHADPTRWQCTPCGVTGPPRRDNGDWTCDLCDTRYTT